MLKHSDLFDELPPQYHDSAFLDRIHFYIPGWEVDIIRGEMFSDGYGFVVDYIAEVLKYLRNEDYSNKYQDYFELSSDMSTRDRDGIHKTFSGLMKIMYPSGEASKEEIEEILKFAVEGRKRVKDQVMRIDSTYAATNFSYTDLASGNIIKVYTVEEKEYPHLYKHLNIEDASEVEVTNDVESNTDIKALTTTESTTNEPKEQHLEFMENQKGITYNMLFGDYLKGATDITIIDPYIRIFFQARNLMEFVEAVVANKSIEDSVNLHLITIADDRTPESQLEFFEQIQLSAQTAGVVFTWEFDTTETIHARSIVTDTGWKISLDRGLDIFQQYAMNDAFSLANRLQQYRGCKAFEVTYIRLGE